MHKEVSKPVRLGAEIQMEIGESKKDKADAVALPMPRLVENPAANVLTTPHGHHGDFVAETLGVDVEQGLSDSEAALRLKLNGPNTLEKQDGTAWWRLLLRQFSSIVVWLLLAATVVAWLTNGVVEAAAIFTVLLLNAIIGFAIEWKAGRELDALRDQTITTARVRREGRAKTVDASELVIGDIIIVNAGDRVPTDARLLEAANLQADESALTGESLPVTKTIESVSVSSILTERRSMLYLGTMVVAGRGVAIVTATGTNTEIGRVGQLLAKTQSEKTPLERRLESLGKILVYIVLAIAAVIFIAGLLQGDDPGLMLEVSISLAVAAVPEALPTMTTLILALGVLRMAHQQAIVRRLSAVEALGSTTVICCDKTGTLTENRMTVKEYRLADGQVLDPDHGGACGDLLTRLLRVSVLCNDATFDSRTVDGHAVGDPTEIALIVAARRLEFDAEKERSKFAKVGEHPFDAATMRMISVLRNKTDENCFAAVKGAPNVVLQMCKQYVGESNVYAPLDEKTRADFLLKNEGMAGRGWRVLAFAEKDLIDTSDDVEDGYTFLGFAGMTDPPRVGVREAIRSAQNAGIRIIMLTGDQVMTARSIAHELNLSDGADIYAMHASEIAGADDTCLAAAAARAHVFARVSPEDKLRIVEALQKAGEIVAVTGDGINDAPALKRADIGIAMGLRGTEVAKEAADVVLTDDNFSTIVTAIAGGRTIYSNIIKFVHLMFSKNLAEVFVIFAAIAAGLPLPLLPLQILWLNLVTDVFPAFALAVEPASAETMKQPPRPPGETLLSRRFLILIGWQGVMLAAISLFAYMWALNLYGEGSHSRTVVLLSIVGVQLGHLFNCRSRTRSAFDGFFRNPYIFAAAASVILLQILAVYLQPLSDILGLVRPNRNDLFVTLGCVVIPIIIVEFTKAMARRGKSQVRD